MAQEFHAFIFPEFTFFLEYDDVLMRSLIVFYTKIHKWTCRYLNANYPSYVACDFLGKKKTTTADSRYPRVAQSRTSWAIRSYLNVTLKGVCRNSLDKNRVSYVPGVQQNSLESTKLTRRNFQRSAWTERLFTGTELVMLTSDRFNVL